jgi:hypothetical protein
LLWRARSPEAIAVLNEALNALSNTLSAEYADVQATLVVMAVPIGQANSAWQHIEQAEATAERLGDAALLARVLAAKAAAHHLCWEVKFACETGLRALALLREDEVWVRANLLPGVVTSTFDLGALAAADALLDDLVTAGRRAGHHGALWVHQDHATLRELLRTGNLRAALHDWIAARQDAPNAATARALVGTAKILLGEIEEGLGELAAAFDEQPPLHAGRGFIEASLFAGEAFANRSASAQALWPSVEPWLPDPGRRNRVGAWMALDVAIVGLAITGDRTRSAALYPSCVAFIDTGVVCGPWSLGASNPQLVAGISAHAAGLTDNAREHFEAAARQARELPHRLLQPTVEYWYGRMLAESSEISDRARGGRMIESAAADFRNLEMVLYADRAERLLQSGEAAQE